MKETMQKVECASCGWKSRRKTGQTVTCPDCGGIAGFDVPAPEKSSEHIANHMNICANAGKFSTGH